MNVGDRLPGAMDERWSAIATTSEQQTSPTETAGIFADSNNRYLIALNIPESESARATLPTDEVTALFEKTGIRVFEERVNREDNLATPIWRAFAICVLVFLLTEGIVSLPPSTRQSATSA